MAYNTKVILKDKDGNPISQYFNKTLGKYEPVEGSKGGNKVVVENNDLSLIPILDKLSQLTGTVIDEETRKSNELQRIAFYEMLKKMLADGELKGDKGVKGDTGNGLEFNWRGTELGVRVKGQSSYIYVDLKGEKGDTGSIENLDKGNIEDALGYTPFNPTDIANNLTTTVAGKALDARQGKVIGDQLENTKGTIASRSNTGVVTTDYYRQVNASYLSNADSIWSQVNVSDKSKSIGSKSQVNASSVSIASDSHTQVNVSQNVMSKSIYTSVFGYSGQGGPSTENIKIELSSFNGTVKASGAITGNSSFADFAEYFESKNGKSIQLGTIVSLAPDGKIKIANQGEYMVGVISQTAGIILNAQGFEWKDRYLYDRYGQPILVDKEIINEETGEVEIIKAPMLNINYKEDEVYIGREDREEWNVVGLTGQIFVNVDNTVREGDFIKVKDNGIGTKGKNEHGQNWQVMKITTPYEENLGFGIALVFVR